MTRRIRFLTVLLSLVSLLLSSAALAGYACPEHQKALVVAQMTEDGAACAETMSRAMDEEQPGLCHAHCQSSSQSADSFHPPLFADVLELGAVVVVPELELRVSLPAPVAPALLQRETGPPLAVRNCCFRI